MQRNTRTMSLKDCYDILNLTKEASLEDVKHAYRLRAFELHPDLNPGDPLAAKKFQQLNEAYVALSAILKSKEGEKSEETSNKETSNKETSSETHTTKAAGDKRREKADKAYAEQDVLRDLLNDPFARRVFEDIYSELAKKQAERASQKPEAQKKAQEEEIPKQKPAPKKKPADEHVQTMQKEAEIPTTSSDKGVSNFVKGWLRRQIDESLTYRIQKGDPTPGQRLRLKIRQGFSNELKVIDVTLPKDFVLGKPIRLRGLGKRVGPWQGDLYLTLVPGEIKRT